MAAQFAADLAQNPENAQTYMTFGLWQHACWRWSQALVLFDRAVTLAPNDAHACDARASLLATSPDAAVRDGVAALRDAHRALELADAQGTLDGGWKHCVYLQILAAALAEVGDWAGALQPQREALALAVTNRGRDLSQTRLKAYRSQRPLREPAGLLWGIHASQA